MNTQTTYTYNELSDKAKQRVLEKWAESSHFDLDHIIDDHKSYGSERGFDIEDVRWSGFYSQGDGASWQGQIRIDRFLDHYLKEDTHDHHRYIVLRELMRDGWCEGRANVHYSGAWYANSAHMNVEYNDGADPLIATPYATIESPDSVLQGAGVRELAEGINLDTLLNDLTVWMQTEAREYADEIFHALRKEYEYLTSEEHMAEMAEANDYRFDDDGNFV